MKPNYLLIAGTIVAGLWCVAAKADVAAVAPPAEPTVQPPESIYDRAFDEAFKKSTEGWLVDPLRFIEEDMALSYTELNAMKTDKPVQKIQHQAFTRLEAVIKLLEKECSGGAGGGANPTKPLGKSVIAKGPGGQGEMHDPKAGDKQWATLPPKQREQILQSKTQGFPPGFEAVLQSYYQRLAQEQVDGASPAAAPAGDEQPATQGAK